MDDQRHGFRWWGILVICSVFPIPALAQGSAAPEYLTVVAAGDCAEDTSVDVLRKALSARLSETRIRVEETGSQKGAGAQSHARLVWRRGGEGDRCALYLASSADGPGRPSRLELAKSAEAPTIRNAASRIAWLLSVQMPPPEGRSESKGSAKEGEQPKEGDGEGGGGDEDAREGSNPQPRAPREEESGADNPESTDEDESDSPSATDSDAGKTGASKAEGGQTPAFSGGRQVPFRMTLVPWATVPTATNPDGVPAYAFNFVGRNYALKGVEFGLLANTEKAYADGAQFSGLVNWVSGPTRGLQAALGLNVSADRMAGAELTLGGNVSGRLEGLQAGLVGNLARGKVAGVQLGGVNWATKAVQGVQAGAVNVAGGDVEGFQGGLLNVGRDVDGVQLGLVNIAKESEVSLGLLNINWGRPAYLMSWMNETGLISAGLHHGSEHVYHILRLGYQPFGRNRPLVPGVGFGGHFPFEVSESLGAYLEVDALYNLAIPTGDTGVQPAHWAQLRLTFGLEFTRRVAAFAGVSANALAPLDAGPSLAPPDRLPSVTDANGHGLWPGFFAGMRF